MGQNRTQCEHQSNSMNTGNAAGSRRTFLKTAMALAAAGLMVWQTLAWTEPVSVPPPLARLTPAAGQDHDGAPDAGMQRVFDERLDREVWESNGEGQGWMRTHAPLPEAFDVVARVRILEEGRTVTLSVGTRGDEADWETDWELSLSPIRCRRRRIPLLNARTRRMERQRYLEDATRLAAGARQALPPALPPIPSQFDLGARFTTPPSPLADAGHRMEIEAALAAQEARGANTERWHELRIERRPDRLRMFVNGIPIGEHRGVAVVEGDALLRFDPSVRIDLLEVRLPADDDDAFYTVDLRERLNARAEDGDDGAALAGGALPSSGSRIEIDGIPFIFNRDPGGNDHVDLSPSFFRDRNVFPHRGMLTRFVWPDPVMEFDPGRIGFWVPNRAYTRIWLLAAFDETPHAVPVVTARFFKSGRGFPVDAAVTVPGLSARSDPAATRRLPVTRADGSRGSLWLVPIDLDTGRLAGEMREMDAGGATGAGAHGWDGRRFALPLELTKEVYPMRAYPDPHNYGWFQGGPPSGVRIFGMTLEEAPVHMVASGNRHGNAYVEPEKPVWQVDLNNQRREPVTGRVRLTVTDPYGNPVGEQDAPFTLTAAAGARLEIPLRPEYYGLHSVLTEVEIDMSPHGAPGLWRRLTGRAGDRAEHAVSFARLATFIQLPPDERQTSEADSRWGLWGYSPSGHGTQRDIDDALYVFRAAGARYTSHDNYENLRRWGMRRRGRHIGTRSPPAWVYEDPYDAETFTRTRENIGREAASRLEANPTIPSHSMFIETAITRALTLGIPRRYLGEDPEWSDEEARRVRGFMVYGRAICEGIREHAPDARIALGWADEGLTIPLLQSGFDRELFDYIGVDNPVFERTPEMPIRELTPNRMWLLRQALVEYGYEDVPVLHTESYFPSSNPLALGWRRSADHYVRMLTLSLAMARHARFPAVLGCQDVASYYGSQHYGEYGILGRQPEANPKPAFAAYATMTRLLDPGEYQGFVPTGSYSAYCLHFTSNGRHVYPMWTLRGRREARLTLHGGATVAKIDESGNTFPLELTDGIATVWLTPTAFWIVSDQPIEAVTLGKTDHTFVRTEHPLMEASFADGRNPARYRPENQVAPGEHVVLLDALETPWRQATGPYEPHAEGHWGAARYDVPMQSRAMRCEQRDAMVWEIELDEPDVQRELAAWYTVFEPETPIPIPGRARTMGIWADGRSNWGRIVYEIEDAEGEIWRSTGTKDNWNCDDIHTWSFFNFDGWRYLEFPLPGHLPYDDFRMLDTTWWGSENGDRVVQLPVRLRRIIVEMRTHNIYVDELIEVEDRCVRLHRLLAVYDDAEAMTDAPIEAQRTMAEKLVWDVGGAPLPNPIAEWRETGVGEPTDFVSLAPPDEYDGLVTRLRIGLRPVEGATEYRIHVAAYQDGRGAAQIARDAEPELEIRGLQPGIPLYLFATYLDGDGNVSRPTDARRIFLKDDFPYR